MRSECKETRLNMSLTFSGEGIIKRVPLLYLPHGSVALTPKCFSIKLKVWQHANSKQHSCTRAQRLSIPSVKNFTKAAERARCHTTTSCLTRPADQPTFSVHFGVEELTEQQSRGHPLFSLWSSHGRQNGLIEIMSGHTQHLTQTLL